MPESMSLRSWGLTSPRRLALAVAFVGALTGGLVLHFSSPASGQDAATSARESVVQAVQDMEGATPAQAFRIAKELDRLGPAGIEAATGALAAAGPRARLGLARYLFGQKQRKPALAALRRTITAEEDPLAAKVSAEMVARYGKSREVRKLLGLLDVVRNPSVKIALAKALRERARDTSAGRVLKDYLRSDDFDVRAQAALALGDIGNVESAKAILSELAEEPTERGQHARSLLSQEKLFESLRRSQGLEGEKRVKLLEGKIDALERDLKLAKRKASTASASGAKSRGVKLLEEISRNVTRYYVEGGEKIESKSLFDQAAKGMISSLDPFSSYMTEKETERFRQSMRGKYAGIGAVVSMDPKDKLLTIIRPIYSGPAYRAGLRSLDKITKVEGESTFGKTIEELVTQLKGDAGTEVNIKVYRKGWKKERPFTLTRGTITLKSVHRVMLPGGVGYVSLSQFGNEAVKEVEAALNDLEAKGMKALIFDLPGNPGGLLTAAVGISDKFLRDNKLIVYSEGRNSRIAPRREYRTHQSTTHPDYPMVVLVNGSSASAAEIVSGALQDHKRAVLVGTNTFGKGSVQQLMRVRTTGNRSTLRLTIAKYYLPSGRCIHRDPKTGVGGIDPSIVVKNDSRPAWEVEEAARIRETGKLSTYVEELWKKDKALAEKLALFDAREASRYPGFDAFYASLKTAMPKNSVRMMVRGQLRRLAQDDLGQEFAMDLEEDVQLQRGVYEALARAGIDISRFAEYGHFATKFAKAPKKPTPEDEPR